MRKWLTIIALAILTVGLIIGGIICFVQYSNQNGGYGTGGITAYGFELAGGIAMFLGGIATGIMTIANFFKMKVRDAD